MVMACEWILNGMAILWGEKRSEKIRVERPDSLLNFDMAIYSGDHNREGGGRGRCTGDKRRLFFFIIFSFSKPLPKSNNGPGAGGKRAKECPTANNNDRMDSFVIG